MPFGHEEFLAANPNRKCQHGVSGKLQLGHFEAAIVSHCNMSCVGCNHMSPVAPKSFMDVEQLRKDLLAITSVAEFWKFAMLGGEPILHPRIDDMIEMAMSIPNIPEVAIITNGTMLDRMSERFWNTVRKIEISVYPTLAAHKIEYIKRRCSQKNIVLMLVPQSQFAMALSPAGQSEAQIQARFERCPTGKECYAIENGYFGKCPQSFIIPRMFLNLENNPDTIPLDGITVEKLRAFVENRKALKSCSRCSVAEQHFTWHECRPSEWIEKSTAR